MTPSACALFCVSDSYLSQLANRHNLVQNTLAAEPITLLDSLAPLPPAPGLVLMKISKTLALLEQQLYALGQVMGPDTTLFAAGKIRDMVA